jgi:outer membrane protein TolC
MSTRQQLSLAGMALALAGCATFSDDGGLGKVGELAQARTGVAVTLPHGDAGAASARDRVEALLAQPLSADAAVEIALLNNPGFRVRLAELGIAEAERVQAGRLPNPRFAFSNQRSSDAYTIDRLVILNVVPLLVWPWTQQMEAMRFDEAQHRLAADAVRLAAETRRAWIAAVASNEQLAYAELVLLAAQAAGELAQRMQQAGNFSALARMREQAFAADAAAQLARARQLAASERERLTRLLGLWGSGLAFTLPARLPELPAAPLEPRDAEQTAMEQRLDILEARRAAEATAASLGLIRATRFVNVLEVGYGNESASGERRQSGYEIEVALPLFDWGDAKVARAEAVYRAALERTREVAINARSEVRESYGAYRTAFDLARHYRDEIVPLRRRIADEMLLRYNGMLIGVFELIADSREQIGSVTASIEALREYWLADVDLRAALAGGGPGGAARAARGTPAPVRASAGH